MTRPPSEIEKACYLLRFSPFEREKAPSGIEKACYLLRIPPFDIQIPCYLLRFFPSDREKAPSGIENPCYLLRILSFDTEKASFGIQKTFQPHGHGTTEVRFFSNHRPGLYDYYHGSAIITDGIRFYSPGAWLAYIHKSFPLAGPN